MPRVTRYTVPSMCEVARKRFSLSEGEIDEFHRRGGQIDASEILKIIPHEKTRNGSVLLLVDFADGRSWGSSPGVVEKFLDSANKHDEALWLILGLSPHRDMEHLVEYWVLDRQALGTMLRECTTLYAGHEVRTHFKVAKGGDGKPTSWVDTQYPVPPEIMKLANCYGTWKITPEEFITLNGGFEPLLQVEARATKRRRITTVTRRAIGDAGSK